MSEQFKECCVVVRWNFAEVGEWSWIFIFPDRIVICDRLNGSSALTPRSNFHGKIEIHVIGGGVGSKFVIISGIYPNCNLWCLQRQIHSLIKNISLYLKKKYMRKEIKKFSQKFPILSYQIILIFIFNLFKIFSR